ncbi:MAG: hypothetical protein ACI39H_04610 [Lachnospiraceae bacterium]
MKKRDLQVIILLALCLCMLFCNVSIVSAAGKTTIKTISNIKFTKATGASTTKLGEVTGQVATSKYVMYLKKTSAGKPYLVYTSNGKSYKQVDLTKQVQKLAGVTSKKAAQYYFAGISAVGNEVIISGSTATKKPFQLRTTNGSKYTYHVMKSTDNGSGCSEMLKVGDTYVLIRSFSESNDKYEESSDGATFTSKFLFYISKDKKVWNKKYISLDGIVNNQGNCEFRDTLRKENQYAVLSGVKTDGTYLYIGIIYRPHSEGGVGNASEYYVYRTKDFETYEKINSCEKEPLEGSSWYEDITITKSGIMYGLAEDWAYNEKTCEEFLDSFTFTRAENNDSAYEEVFSYDAGQYEDHTFGYLNNWNSDGTMVSLFFKRKEGNSLFVSEDGKTDYKEFSTSIDPEKCRGIWEDTKNGYKIMGYDNMKYLLFSKDGFVKTYKVKLPTGTQSVAVKGNLLLVTVKQGNYYIGLSTLYGKMK